MTKYSVIMSTYNRAAYLRQAVDSVLGQTFRDFEMIVCDDGSTDNTQAILDSYGGRIRTVRGPHKGTGAGLNSALALAQGDFVSILDSDDLWMPWTLEHVNAVVAAQEQPACVYLCPTYFGNDFTSDTPPRPGPLAYRAFNSYADAPPHVPNGTGMLGAMPRQILVETGGFAEWLHGCTDHDLLLRCARRMRYVSLDAPATVFVRQHAGRSLNAMQSRYRGVCRLLDNQRRGLYGSGADDAPVAARVGQEGLSVALYLAAQFGAWRESAHLFRRVLRILPRRRVPGAYVWYGGYLGAVMTSRLLEQLGRHCARRLSAPWSAARTGKSAP